MDDRVPKEQNDYKFLHEKIVKRRKLRVRKYLVQAVVVVILAVVFGTVSRICFITSEPYINILLGITPTPTPKISERQPVTLPMAQNELTPTGIQTSSLPSSTPSCVETSNSAEEISDETQNPSTGSDNTEQDGTIALNKFMEAYQAVRQIATNAASTIATVTVTTTETDWFEQTYEKETAFSGIIIGENNVELLVLTTSVPLLNAESIRVTVGGFTTDETVIYSIDEDYNLAVIGIPYASIPTMNLEAMSYAVFGESNQLQIGTPILVIGSPNGYSGSFEFGTVTAKNSYAYVTDDQIELFNISMQDYDNGSGFVLNTSGEIIGILTQSFKEGINQNISTAVGISRLKPVIRALVNGQGLNYFGVVAKEMSESLIEEARTDLGVQVTKVCQGSPAEKAGIQVGDIIQIIERNPMRSAATLRDLLEEGTPKTPLRVTILRKGRFAYTEVETLVHIDVKQLLYQEKLPK